MDREERLVEAWIGVPSFSEGPTGTDMGVSGVFAAAGWTGARNGPCPGDLASLDIGGTTVS